MIPKTSMWGTVKVNMHIQDGTGKTWKVGAINDTHVGIVDRDGKEIVIERPPAERPVNVFYLTQGELEGQIRDLLGGKLEVVKRPEDSIFICREFETMTNAEKISHIRLMHRVWVGDVGAKGPKALAECHDEIHQNPDHKWVPHIHADRLNTPSPFDQEVRP